jgi:hypothetical protein
MHAAVHNVKETRGKAPARIRFAENARFLVENVPSPDEHLPSRLERTEDEACRSIAGGC